MKLDLYFAARFMRALGIVCGLFIGLVLMLESVEQIRRLSDHSPSAGEVVSMALLRLPDILYDLLPIIVVIATLVMYLGLARSSELVVARAAGRSALRSLLAPVFVVFLFGLFVVAILNPVTAASKRAYEIRVAKYEKGEQQVFSVSDEGLWLREGDQNGQKVIRAARSNLNGSRLFEVTFLAYDKEGRVFRRIEANSAEIKDQEWHLLGVKQWLLKDDENPEASAQTLSELRLPTRLTNAEIQDRFGAPDAVSIWDTPAHILKLEAAGFSARSFKMNLQSELALPATFIAMVMIGAGLTMRHTRLGRTSLSVFTAIMLAFGYYFLQNFVAILGESGELPTQLAAWAPPTAAILATLALLLHLEDG